MCRCWIKSEFIAVRVALFFFPLLVAFVFNVTIMVILVLRFVSTASVPVLVCDGSSAGHRSERISVWHPHLVVVVVVVFLFLSPPLQCIAGESPQSGVGSVVVYPSLPGGVDVSYHL
jgi:hypothetical protein